MSKRRRSDDEDGSRSRRRRNHLHLVVDDWTKGYSIYKVDVADLDGADPGADLDSVATPLPGPPAFRLESCHANYSCPWFSSVGGKIAAMRYNEEQEDAPVLLYDTTTGGLAVGPRTPAEARFAGTFVPNNGADDRLYMMGTSKFRDGEDNFQVLAEEGGRWAWSSLPTPPFRTSKAASDAACCATHPDGRTIFFSVYAKGTFSFDTETHEWKRHGDWMLPFLGRAYYDAQLDAWVGIDSSAPEKGGVCSCDVVPTCGDHQGPPAGKTAKEKVIVEDLKRTKKVKLVHMGRGKFCLVEQRFRKGVDVDIGDNVYLFYITAFKLRYGKSGELLATDRRTRSYTMPQESTGYNWWVFGI
jgi:hypothetical protein